MQRFPVICGPTASGKSALAVELALHLHSRGTHAEVITADAFQVYRGLDIGTAKPTLAERRGIEHRLIDIAEPAESFTLDRWLALAEAEIARVRAVRAGDGSPGVPIVVGGTHLYVKALLEGLFQGPAADPALRERLTAMDPAARRAQLERIDPAAAARIHPNDVRRAVRALEVFTLTGTPLSAQQGQWDSGTRRADARVVVIEWSADQLSRSINARVRAMMNTGLLDEVRGLVASGRLPTHSQAAQALGYKQLLPLVSAATQRGAGAWPPPPGLVEQAAERIKIETRRFAKNQRTWLRRIAAGPGTVTIDGAALIRDGPEPSVRGIIAAL